MVDKLTAPNGPLEQLTTLVDTLNHLAPAFDALVPTVNTLNDAVNGLSTVVNPLSNIADRIPLSRRPGRRSPNRSAGSHRIIDAD